MLVSLSLVIHRIKNSLLLVLVRVDTEHQLHCNVSSGIVVPLKNSVVLNSDSNTTAQQFAVHLFFMSHSSAKASIQVAKRDT